MQEDAMTDRSRFTCVGALFVALFIAAVATAGTTIDKRTTFTFNTPIAVPGVVLPAGSYLFRVVNTETSRDVVQVLSGDGKTPYAMFFTLQAWRSEPAQDPELTFIETAADMPHAIRTWWHPGESIGYEFLYPREQARRLARGSGTPVRAMELPSETWIEPELVPPEVVGPAVEAAPEAAVAEAPAEEAIPYEALPTTASPLTVMLTTAIALVALAAGMQLIVRKKQT
jgi:hypothetical protein